MNCEQANEFDLVDYLQKLGHQPVKINHLDYWYLSPFREERTASFKVQRIKNAWYDHGIGKGGKLVDFLMEYHRCNVNEALQKFSQQPVKLISKAAPFHLHNNDVNNVAGETAIKIIAAKQPITSPLLCSYLDNRRIDRSIANSHCHEVTFTIKDKEYIAIGFKNIAGGYELRNQYFKGGSSPKDVTYLENGQAKKITVFEGFFDFLTYQTIHQNQQQELTNYLVLNSLAFFERSFDLMEKHSRVNLYLDNDEAGKKYSAMALKRSVKFVDESKLYEGYKDLNEWAMNLGKLQKIKDLKTHRGKHL